MRACFHSGQLLLSSSSLWWLLERTEEGLAVAGVFTAGVVVTVVAAHVYQRNVNA